MKIGYIDRCFSEHWRPALEEIAFARANGFGALQYMVHPNGQGRPQQSDTPPEALRDALAEAGITPTLEINCRVNAQGLMRDRRAPETLYEQFTPFILTVGCRHVHLHATADSAFDDATIARVEEGLLPQLARGVEWAQAHDFRFAFEHNARNPHYGQIFARPKACAAALAAVPGLNFVWDWNHTHPGDADTFTSLAERVALAHVSDTPLPAVNHHLPLGLGSVPLAQYSAAIPTQGDAPILILEIGGLPLSGGYGRDRDDALLDSRIRLEQAWREANAGRT